MSSIHVAARRACVRVKLLARAAAAVRPPQLQVQARWAHPSLSRSLAPHCRAFRRSGDPALTRLLSELSTELDEVPGGTWPAGPARLTGGPGHSLGEWPPGEWPLFWSLTG
jgi:hypothetical protein